MGFLYGSAGKESACNVGDLGLIPGLGRYVYDICASQFCHFKYGIITVPNSYSCA